MSINGEVNILLNVKDFSKKKKKGFYRAVALYIFIFFLNKLKARCEKNQLPTEVSFEMLQHARHVLYRKA